MAVWQMWVFFWKNFNKYLFIPFATLTVLQIGMQQHYELGKYLRRRYQSILGGDRYINDIVYVRSMYKNVIQFDLRKTIPNVCFIKILRYRYWKNSYVSSFKLSCSLSAWKGTAMEQKYTMATHPHPHNSRKPWWAFFQWKTLCTFRAWNEKIHGI